MNAPWMIFAFLVLLVCFLEEPDQQHVRDQATYCEMVDAYKFTNGQYGWPDYRGIYRKVCK